MVCDTVAASITYNKDNWSSKELLNYFLNRKDLEYINENVKNILIEVYKQIIDNGINKTITSKNLKFIYNNYAKE